MDAEAGAPWIAMQIPLTIEQTAEPAAPRVKQPVAAKVVVGVLAVFAVVCLYQSGHQPHSWANRQKVTGDHHSWKKYPDCIASPFSGQKYPFHSAKRRQTGETSAFRGLKIRFALL